MSANLQDNRAVFRNFISILRFSFDSASYFQVLKVLSLPEGNAVGLHSLDGELEVTNKGRCALPRTNQYQGQVQTQHSLTKQH